MSGMRKTLLQIVAAALVVLGAGYWGLLMYVRNRADGEIHALAERSPDVERIAYDQLRVGLLAPQVEAVGLQIMLKGASAPVTIDKGVADGFSWFKSAPQKLHLRLSGIHLQAGQPYLAAAGLQSLGYDRITADAECAWAYDEKQRVFDLAQLRLAAAGMGELQMALRLVNFDWSQLNQRYAGLQELIMALPMTGLARMQLHYRDDSLLQRLCEADARRAHLPHDAYFERLRQRLKARITKAKHHRVVEVLETFLKFLDDPRQLTLTAAPDQPVPLLRFLWVRKPGDLIRLLKIRASL